jgi:hypothetical protein
MGNGVMAIGPQLPRPSSTLPQEAYGRAGRGSAYRGSAEARVRRAERPPMTRDPTAVANVVDFLTRRFGLGV